MSFDATTTAAEVVAGIDLRGRRAVITGASTGLGRETARALASAGATVILATRDREKTARAVAFIEEAVPGAAVEHVALDLTSLDSVREAAASLVERGEPIHVLVNNAGVMFTPFERTADGFELQFGVNHLGHFLWTARLLPLVVAGAPARIVNVSSAGHRFSGVDLDDPNWERRPYDKFAAYGQSKTANILFTLELEQRFGPRGVHAFAVHPGAVLTELGRYMTHDDLEELRRRGRAGGGLPGFKSVEAGAATSVWAASAPELETRGGAYLADCAVSEDVRDYARDPELARRLWSLSERLVGEAGSRRIS